MAPKIVDLLCKLTSASLMITAIGVFCDSDEVMLFGIFLAMLNAGGLFIGIGRSLAGHSGHSEPNDRILPPMKYVPNVIYDNIKRNFREGI